jgi:hypothetical protein
MPTYPKVRQAELDELVSTTRASRCPADAEPGMTLKLPLRFSTVHRGTAFAVVGADDPVVEVVDPGATAVDDEEVVGCVGRVVASAFFGELLLQPASTRLEIDSETAIATR